MGASKGPQDLCTCYGLCLDTRNGPQALRRSVEFYCFDFAFSIHHPQ